MTPHHLRLTAFGPFAGTVAVDLDALAANGLFLLHGQTGAGKTTLLDGLGYALFGRVPGARQAAKRLRSDYATSEVRTEVQLEVTLAGRYLRITRSPQQERAKTRGTGSTTEPAKVLLEERRGATWSTVSTRVGEADAEIGDLVGMSAEQFFQVVLLPQGEFAQFLRATSVDRAAVLQKLFGTERFAEVEAWLVNRRRSTADEVAVARGSLSQLLARVAQAAAARLPEDDSTTNWAQTLQAAALQAETTAAQAIATTSGLRDDRRHDADAAALLARRQDQLRTALRRRSELDADRPALLGLQIEVAAAARAAEVASVLTDAASRRTARDTALAAEAVARSGLAAAGVAVDLAADGLRRTAADARAQSGRLEALRAVDSGRRAALAEAAQAGDEQADALTKESGFELQLALLPASRALHSARLDAARAAAEKAPASTAERDRLAALRPDLVQLRKAEQQLSSLTEQHLSARETALSLAEKAHDLRAANVNSMIARLAFALEHDTPCPVCGALEHPDPSELRDEGVSSDDEDRARVTAVTAQAEVADLEARVAAERATAASLRARLNGLTLPGVDEALAALEVELSVLREQASQGLPAAADLATLDRQHTELAVAQVAAGAQAAAASRRAAEATRRADTAAAELATGLGSAMDLDVALTGVAALILATTDAADAADALSVAQDELDRAQLLAGTACAAVGFASATDALAAARPPTWREEAAAQLRASADTAAAVAATLADPELTVDLTVPAPVAQTLAAVDAADQLVKAAVADHAEHLHRRTSLEALAPLLLEAVHDLEPLELRAREARTLADLCAGAGANGLKMTLSAYVLAARLEEVAAAASVRLLRMTQGRYALIHTDGAARGGVRSGLGLLARDSWSGQDRDTATLSGGETFLASLALALGLADVVSQEAGGSQIGALFVDEGFGTLDDDTLDEVMDVLDGLREGGRIVGLVSHVAELRQRIPAQVQVTKTRAGSAVVLHGC